MKRLIQLLRVIVAMLVVATIATVIAIRYQYERGNSGTWEDVGGRTTTLTADSLAAEADSSREAKLEPLARAGGAPAAGARRRVVQGALSADARDVALALEPAVRGEAALAVAGLDTTIHVAPESELSPRRATFAVRQAPYLVRADVELRPPPDSAALALRIDLDTALIEVRVGCAGPAVAGIRRAEAVVVAPEWMRVRVGRVEALPGGCEVPAPAARQRRRLWGALPLVALRERVGVTAGYVLAPGLAAPTLGIGLGVRVWP